MPLVARELLVDVPSRRKGAALAAVHALGVMGVQVRDRSSGAPRGRVQVLAWLPPTDATIATAATLAHALGADAHVTWRDVPVTWEGDTAHPVGGRFVVVGPDAVAEPCGRTPLILEAALAFGDGLHPTTALCVEALEALSPRGSVLDVGTGTGILALVAARLGAAPVVAQDIDPLAVWTARRTMAANAVAVDVVEVLPDARFDLVVANLYLAPLLDLVPTLASRLAPDGLLLASGFVEDALPTVTERLRANNLSLTTSTSREGWVAVVARRV